MLKAPVKKSFSDDSAQIEQERTYVTLLNSPEMQEELQHEIKTDRDKIGLFQQQDFEIQQLCMSFESKISIYSRQYNKENFVLTFKKHLDDLNSLPADDSAKNLYLRHTTLNRINEEIIFTELLKIGTYFPKKCNLAEIQITRFPIAVLTNEKYHNAWDFTDTISLRDNYLSLLPQRIFNLIRLKKIEISGNYIYKLPELTEAQEQLFYELSSVYYDVIHNKKISKKEALGHQAVQNFCLDDSVVTTEEDVLSIRPSSVENIKKEAIKEIEIVNIPNTLEVEMIVEDVETTLSASTNWEIKQEESVPVFMPIFALSKEPIKNTTKNQKSFLIIDTTQERKNTDLKGAFSYYPIFLMTSMGEKIEQTQWPVDVKQYGEIEDIQVFDGTQNTSLKSSNDIYERLVTFLSTDFSTLRKGIKRNTSGYENFDCQKFSYYLSEGEEGVYPRHCKIQQTFNYKEDKVHAPYNCYEIKGQKENFGKNGKYSQNDFSIHYYTYLNHNVFVSKYGSLDVKFTSYQQILDAYVPKEEFTKGERSIMMRQNCHY